MTLSKKSIEKFQEIFKKDYGQELSYDEASDSARRLVGLFEILQRVAVRDLRHQEKLKEFPKGFSFMDDKNYNCNICYRPIKNEQLWYDKWGIKCLACQDAINKKIIPGGICRNDKSWYSTHNFESYFKLKTPAVRKLVRQGILKVRIIPKNGFEVFLIEDNEETLPPKKLTEPKVVKEVKENGEEWHHLEPWYKFVDPFKVLKGYKIMDYMQLVKDSVD